MDGGLGALRGIHQQVPEKLHELARLTQGAVRRASPGDLFGKATPRRGRTMNAAGVRGRGLGISVFPCALLRRSPCLREARVGKSIGPAG
jgi:hypothetical protein